MNHLYQSSVSCLLHQYGIFHVQKIYSILTLSINFLLPSITLSITLIGVRIYSFQYTSSISQGRKLSHVNSIKFKSNETTDDENEREISASVHKAIVTRLLIKVSFCLTIYTLPANVFNLLHDFHILDFLSDNIFDNVFTLIFG